MPIAADAAHSDNNSVLILAALLGIATVVVLITWLKIHPFLALIFGSAVLGLVAGLGPTPTVDSFVDGLGSTVGSVGLLIALGAMIGGLLTDSGGAEQIVQTITGRVSGRALPWAMAGAAALVGIPLAWLVAVGIRLATGSATVATITAAGIVAPLAQGLDRPGVALVVLAIGAGSLFFSHVNDAGFWLVKEYFGLSVGQTIKTWSVMETIISVVAGGLVLLLSLII
jgi:gluconate:H+ symporter, GntP family